MSILAVVQRCVLVLGAGLLLFYAAARVHGEVGLQQEVRRFHELQQAAAVDQSLWSAERVAAYEKSLQKSIDDPLALLRIPRIGLEVPVLDGIDELTLNRAVGRIPDTARPGENGNIGIAGHRDGFFRGLKDVAHDDVIELDTLSGTEIYTVDAIRIVGPDHMDVLDEDSAASMTLVTCFPFYYVGSAPQRYIVHAVRTESMSTVAAVQGD